MGFKAGGGVGGGWGGRSPPLCKHIMIRATFPYCKNGDDMMLVAFIASMDGVYKSGGVGAGAPPAPPFANTKIRATFPTANTAMT